VLVPSGLRGFAERCDNKKKAAEQAKGSASEHVSPVFDSLDSSALPASNLEPTVYKPGSSTIDANNTNPARGAYR
jgi:hypothetical protein